MRFISFHFSTWRDIQLQFSRLQAFHQIRCGNRYSLIHLFWRKQNRHFTKHLDSSVDVIRVQAIMDFRMWIWQITHIKRYQILSFEMEISMLAWKSISSKTKANQMSFGSFVIQKENYVIQMFTNYYETQWWTVTSWYAFECHRRKIAKRKRGHILNAQSQIHIKSIILLIIISWTQ